MNNLIPIEVEISAILRECERRAIESVKRKMNCQGEAFKDIEKEIEDAKRSAQ